MVVEVILGFIATLTATLMGVLTAFGLNRRAEVQRSKKHALQHLEALEKELELNGEMAHGNKKVADTFSYGHQRDADHYVMERFSTSAWESALESQLVQELDSQMYQELQYLYVQIENTNELIHRLRTEFLHPEMGEKQGRSGYESEVWTINVGYWDHDDGEYDFWGLGVLIESRSKDVNRHIGRIMDDIDAEEERIQGELEDTESEWWYKITSDVFGES